MTNIGNFPSNTTAGCAGWFRWRISLADNLIFSDHESSEEDQEFPPDLIERWRREVQAQKESLFGALSLPLRGLHPIKKDKMSYREMTRYLDDSFEGWRGTHKSSENVSQ